MNLSVQELKFLAELAIEEGANQFARRVLYSDRPPIDGMDLASRLEDKAKELERGGPYR